MGETSIAVSETWGQNGGTSANGNSAVRFIVRYETTLTEQRSGWQHKARFDFDQKSPVDTIDRQLPFREFNATLGEGTYFVAIRASFWKQTGNRELILAERSTQGYVFLLNQEHGGFAIAEPTTETKLLMDATRFFAVGVSDPPRQGGAIIPPGAVTEPTLVWVDIVENHNAGFEGQAGPIFEFQPSMEFAKPVTLVIPYDARINDALGVREAGNFVVHVGTDGTWEPLLFDSEVDIFNDTIIATTPHFSLFSSLVKVLTVAVKIIAVFDAVVKVAEAVIVPIVKTMVQWFITDWNDVYVELMDKIRRQGYGMTPLSSACRQDFFWCAFPVADYNGDGTIGDENDKIEASKTPIEGDDFRSVPYGIQTAAYLELLNANTPEHMLDDATSRYPSRRERIRDIAHAGLVLMATEAANYTVNESLRDQYGNPDRTRDGDGGAYEAYGARGWGTNRREGTPGHRNGWMTSAEVTGLALDSLFAASMAIRQFIAEDPTGCLADAPMFPAVDYFTHSNFKCAGKPSVLLSKAFNPNPQENDDDNIDELWSLFLFMNPDRSDSATEISECLNSWYNSTDIPKCFSISKNLRTLTYAQAERLFTYFGKQVLDWWIANAMTTIYWNANPADGVLGYSFWYFSQPNECHDDPADGCAFYSDASVVHNVNMIMGRAAFMYYRLASAEYNTGPGHYYTNTTEELESERHYLEIAKGIQRIYRLAHFDCKELGTGEWSKCHVYGALAYDIGTKPYSPGGWRWNYRSCRGETMRETEDASHLSTSAALNGLLSGDSLFNDVNYGLAVADHHKQITVNNRQYFNFKSNGATTVHYNSFQRTNAYLGQETRLRFKKDSKNIWYLDPVPDYSSTEYTYPRELLDGAVYPNYDLKTGKTFEIDSCELGDYANQVFGGVDLPYYVEGATADSFELLYQWFDAYDQRTDFGLGNEQLPIGTLTRQTALKLAWGAKSRADGQVVAPQVSPVITSVQPYRVAVGGTISLFGKYFSATPYTVWVDTLNPLQASNWTNSRIDVRIPPNGLLGALRPGAHTVHIDVGEPAPGFLLPPLRSKAVTFEIHAPLVSGIFPANVRKGGEFTIYGSYFGDTPHLVTVDGVPAVIKHWSNTRIDLWAPLPNGAGAPRDGAVPVIVNVHGYTAAGSVSLFEAPFIASSTPETIAVGGSFMLNGDSFTSYMESAALEFNGYALGDGWMPEYWSGTEIAATLPVTFGPGGYPVRVIDMHGVGSNSVNQGVAYPLITSIDPAVVPLGTTLYVSGSYFGATPYDVSIGGVWAPIVTWSDNLIAVAISNLPIGAYEVEAQVAGYPSNRVPVSISARVDSVVPHSVTGGEILSIRGDFQDIEGSVSINGMELSPLSWSASEILLSIPNDLPGGLHTGSVTVNGVAVPFAVEVRPTILSIVPVSGSSNDTFRLTGTNLATPGQEMEVLWGAAQKPTEEYLSWDSSSVTGTIPLTGDVGVGQVVIDIESVRSLPLSFEFLPRLNQVKPVSVLAGGSTVELKGTNFGVVPGAVDVDGLIASVINWDTDKVRAALPASLAGGVYEVAVETGAYRSNTISITVVPGIDYISPTSATVGSWVEVGAVGLGSDLGRISVNIDDMPLAVRSGTLLENGSFQSVFVRVPYLAQGAFGMSVTVNGVTGEAKAFAVEHSDLIRQVAMGDDFTCVLRGRSGQNSDRRVECWGQNQFSQLGTSTVTYSTTPRVVDLPLSVSAIAASDHSVCAIADQDVYCWGRNDMGQLARAASTTGSPGVVRGVNRATQIAAGRQFFCAIDGRHIKCWGSNLSGQLGAIGFGGYVTDPQEIGFDSPRILALGGETACAANDSELLCWGSNLSGQLGDGTTVSVRTEPAPEFPTLRFEELQGISLGENHGCATYTPEGGGAVSTACWGGNQFGQLSDGSLASRNFPAPVELIDPTIREIAAGGSHTCAVRSVGDAVCWGENAAGAAGTGDFSVAISTPTAVWRSEGRTNRIVAARGGACAITDYGAAVRCWGENSGAGLRFIGPAQAAPILTYLRDISLVYGTVAGVTASPGEETVVALAGVDTVTIGGKAALVVDKTNGRFVMPAGLGAGEHFGVAVTAAGVSTFAVTVAEGRGLVLSVDGGRYHSCVIKEDGAVACWGSNSHGQLGTGDFINRAEPREVIGLPATAEKLALGLDSTCALLATREVWCWGSNEFHDLGAGTVAPVSAVPVYAGLSGVKDIAAGYRYYCFTNDSGQMYCWGVNLWYGLGDQSPSTTWGLRPIVGLPGPVDAMTGAGGTTCAIVSGDVYCWGYNGHGEAGRSSDWFLVPAPNRILGLEGTAIKVSGGQYHICAQTIAPDKVQCWGDNRASQLGDGTTRQNSYSAVDVVGIGSVLQLESHITNSHSCVLLLDQTVACWGDNSLAQLGNPDVSIRSNVPVPVAGLENADSLGLGYLHSCATHSGNAGVKCWGDNRAYQLGVSGISISATPVEAWLRELAMGTFAMSW